MRVLVTRAEPAASRTADLLKNSGYEPIKLPLFEICDTGNEIPTTHCDGYIFTSNNALKVLQDRKWQPIDPHVPVFCVGQKTAETAKKFGFSNVTYKQGGGAQLMPEILSSKIKTGAVFFYFTTPDRSYDIQSELKEAGLKVDNIEIYKSACIQIDDVTFTSAFNKAEANIVFTYSKRSSNYLAQKLRHLSHQNVLNNITLISISKQALGALSAFNWKETLVANVANEQAMLHILKSMRGAKD